MISSDRVCLHLSYQDNRYDVDFTGRLDASDRPLAITLKTSLLLPRQMPIWIQLYFLDGCDVSIKRCAIAELVDRTMEMEASPCSF